MCRPISLLIFRYPPLSMSSGTPMSTMGCVVLPSSTTTVVTSGMGALQLYCRAANAVTTSIAPASVAAGAKARLPRTPARRSLSAFGNADSFEAELYEFIGYKLRKYPRVHGSSPSPAAMAELTRSAACATSSSARCA